MSRFTRRNTPLKHAPARSGPFVCLCYSTISNNFSIFKLFCCFFWLVGALFLRPQQHFSAFHAFLLLFLAFRRLIPATSATFFGFSCLFNCQDHIYHCRFNFLLMICAFIRTATTEIIIWPIRTISVDSIAMSVNVASLI